MSDYRWINKDPVIDVIRTEMQRHGNLSSRQIDEVAYGSGVSPSTIREWLFGDTRRPQSLSTRFVLEELGVKIMYQRVEDKSFIRQSAPELIPKAQQEAILRKDREREREREKAKAKEKGK